MANQSNKLNVFHYRLAKSCSTIPKVAKTKLKVVVCNVCLPVLQHTLAEHRGLWTNSYYRPEASVGETLAMEKAID
jgi:hypothetical protein